MHSIWEGSLETFDSTTGNGDTGAKSHLCTLGVLPVMDSYTQMKTRARTHATSRSGGACLCLLSVG